MLCMDEFFKLTVGHEKSLGVRRSSRPGPGGSEHGSSPGRFSGVRRTGRAKFRSEIALGIFFSVA